MVSLLLKTDRKREPLACRITGYVGEGCAGCDLSDEDEENYFNHCTKSSSV